MTPKLTEQILNALNGIPHGWCSIGKALELAETIVENKLETALEIGVYAGRSFIPMALAFKYRGMGKAIGVDPWDASASIEGQTGADKEWWGKLDHQMIYSGFNDKLAELQLHPFVDVFRVKSSEFSFGGFIDLLHIDGNHGQEAVSDASRFAPLVRAGGFAFLDDINWAGDGVKRAVAEIEAMGFEKQYERDTGAMFRKIA
jgi:predicted O-methyltransferase YrrM